MAIRVLLLGESWDELEKIEGKITDNDFSIVGASAELGSASDEVVEHEPDVVVMSCSDLSWVFRACQQIYLLHPNVVTVMVSDEKSYEIAKKAIDSGATAYISPIPDSSEFCDRLKKIYFNEKSRVSMLIENSGVQRKAEVITVFGTKGGVGKTTLAVNLAVELSRKKAKVAILDLDLLFGDAHMFLGLDVKETVVELLQERKVPTIDSVRNYFLVHSSGVQLLCAPISPEYAENVTASQVEPLLNVLRPHYDYIIIDTNADFSELNLLLLEEASTILYVTGLDISLLNNSKKGLLLLDSLNLSGKIKIVVSKSFKGDISKGDVEKIMGKPVFATISNDYIECVKSLNQGVPIVQGSKSPIAKDIVTIAGAFRKHDSESGNDEQDEPRKFSFDFLKLGGRK
ncbi:MULTISPECIES: AAA family ATPase [unclassified Parvimonas]|jgi:hypothetical protein|uniref:AAA family ATPase n=1 Tax=unclassified Parvimonas TaxID=1151464 RepID=UPI002B47F280|nr:MULTISPECIES: AAA family ATPase [unclassified Parvimonas]MEB3024441.1 AAA family ATPase [Parvimonas sp. M13]MEB3072488.1 AAA family ATPase [Parvimonas sp. C2]MEB3088729.1 AAA family ATPase [Parvimonas sp. M20]